MQPTDLTIEVLKGIRDEVCTTNTRIEALRVAQKEGRLKGALVDKRVRDLLT